MCVNVSVNIALKKYLRVLNFLLTGTALSADSLFLSFIFSYQLEVNESFFCYEGHHCCLPQKDRTDAVIQPFYFCPVITREISVPRGVRVSEIEQSLLGVKLFTFFDYMA